jgi:hypothetical protein
MKHQRIFSVEQIKVPQLLPHVLREYSKEVIINNPQNILEFSRQYFERMMLQENNGHYPAEQSLHVLKHASEK